MVREEGKRDKMRTKMGRRAIAYEKLKRGGGTLWAKKCWEKVKDRGGKRGSISISPTKRRIS